MPADGTRSMVQSGQDLVLKAEDWNYAMRGAELAHRIHRVGDHVEHAQVPSLIKVLNASGYDLPRFAVVGLGQAVCQPQSDNEDEFCRQVAVEAIVPTPELDAAGLIAILQEPIPQDEVGLAAVVGATPCRLYLPASHGSGDPPIQSAGVYGTDYTRLYAEQGHIPVLWHEPQGGPGEVWSYVRLPTVPRRHWLEIFVNEIWGMTGGSDPWPKHIEWAFSQGSMSEADSAKFLICSGGSWDNAKLTVKRPGPVRVDIRWGVYPIIETGIFDPNGMLVLTWDDANEALMLSATSAYPVGFAESGYNWLINSNWATLQFEFGDEHTSVLRRLGSPHEWELDGYNTVMRFEW